MENEIKVNDFVRLKDGTIAKVLEIKNQDTDILNWYCLDNDMGTMDRSIVKHSPNLIDLIEVNDICIMSYNGIVFQKFVSRDDIVALKLKEYKLLEILTKEQFESISYKVTKM